MIIAEVFLLSILFFGGARIARALEHGVS